MNHLSCGMFFARIYDLLSLIQRCIVRMFRLQNALEKRTSTNSRYYTLNTGYRPLRVVYRTESGARCKVYKSPFFLF